MEYDVIFVVGEMFFDHPLCGTALLKRLLEREGFSVGIIEMPTKESDVKKLGKPRLFFGVSSGSIDSMVRNYTPLKKLRKDDKNLDYNETVPDRAVIVYSNWIKKNFRDSVIVLGGVEATLRRFTHYDYWENRLRRPILFESRADIIAYGCAEKQLIEIAKRLGAKKDITGIKGTCIISREIPKGFTELPSHEEVTGSKERFCDMQNMLSNTRDLCQKLEKRYILQYQSPSYTTKDLDDYYSLPFKRDIPKQMQGFQFSIVTHRGCIGDCNFCSLTLTSGSRIISRSEKSILDEIKKLTKHPDFTGNIDDLTSPSVNMYGMDCNICEGDCTECRKPDRSNKRLISLLQKARKIKGVKKIFIRSGIRFDLASPELLKELAEHHIFDTLRIAPEHVNRQILRMMNKDKGDLDRFIKDFSRIAGKNRLSFYFMTAHPGSSMKEAKELADAVSKLRNAESIQVFTPTPMTVSTCMYYTGLDPKTKKKVYVPYTYAEKKNQKRIVTSRLRLLPKKR